MQPEEPGIVIATRGRQFEVRLEQGDHLTCEVRQRVKFATERQTPVTVGDYVMVIRTGKRSGVIEQVMPRRSAFFRPAKGVTGKRQIIATNLDQLAIISSAASPPLKTGLIDRFLIAGEIGNLRPVIVINKIDLGRPDGLDDVIEAYRTIGHVVLTVSAMTGEGLPALQEHLSGHITLFAGHSGVGKSTLLNTLIPGLNLKTQVVMRRSTKGRHTTTTIELFELPLGGFALDSPGLKVLGLWEIDKNMLVDFYPDFEKYQVNCRFQPCSHLHEPACAVRAAVDRGELSRFRYENYRAIAGSLKEEPR